MADDKKNIPEAAPPTEAPAPAVENAAVLEQSSPGPVLTDAEAVMLEQEGQAALFEMGEAVPDPADAVTHTEVEEPTAPEVPKVEEEQAQPPDPGKDNPALAHSGKVVDFSAARDEAAKEEKKAVKQKPPTEKDKPAKPGRGRPPKDGKAAPDKAKPPKPRDKKSQSKPAPEKPAVDKGGAPAGAEVTPEPSAPRDATRPVKEEIVYIEVYHAEKQDGVTNQRVVIHYNCIGAFDVPDRRKIPETDIIMETRKGVALSYAPEQVAV